MLCSSHLGCHSPLTLQLALISFECLLSTVFQVSAVVVLGKSMHTTEGCTAVWTVTSNTEGRRSAQSIRGHLELAAFLGHCQGVSTE